MRHIKVLLAALVILLMPVFVIGAASAQGTQGNSIWDGLWSGSHFDLGALNGSKPNSSDKSDRKIYAALGDSVAAGLGLNPKAKPVGNDTRCGRSSQAYGYTVAKSAKLPILLVPCSGATIGDLFTSQGVPGTNIKAQLTRAYEAGTPELITITGGANDAHWSDFIRGCYAYNCATPAYTHAANAYLLALQAKLHAAFLAIEVKSDDNPPPVIITGYYNPVSADCTKYQTNVSAAELKWISSETKALNKTIRDAASHYSFVTYAPVDFTGHDLCSGSSWVQGPDDPAPFHPTAAGQKAIAHAVTAKL